MQVYKVYNFFIGFRKNMFFILMEIMIGKII